MKNDRPYLADIQYFRVDLEIVWALIEQRVAALRGDVARLVAALGTPR